MPKGPLLNGAAVRGVPTPTYRSCDTIGGGVFARFAGRNARATTEGARRTQLSAKLPSWPESHIWNARSVAST